jgi:hypothetical protein
MMSTKLGCWEELLLKRIVHFYWLGTLLLSPLAGSEEPFCPQIASYEIDVRLDVTGRILQGEEKVSWTNATETPCKDLWLHLYWNAFQNNHSTFFQERSQRGGRPTSMQPDDWGYCRISSLRIVESPEFSAADLTSSLAFRQPDDANPADQTVAAVSLPQPVLPGQTIQLEIIFSSRIPSPVSRTGVYRDYYFIAQWFPKLGVFEDGSWNCHQYHVYSEYYADYGTYDVKITVPSSFVVGATGELRDTRRNGDMTRTHTFHQHSVHDFAWVASPDILEFKEGYEFAPGKEVEITLLLQPYHRHLKNRYLDAVEYAVKYASLWYGDYPYSTITCVDPAYNSRSGGMEYPTFFTGGAYFLSREGIPSPEGVTIHEFGHGYFYGLLGSNEFEYPWMDEGLTSYLDTVIYYQAYGPPLYSRRYFGVPVTFPSVRIPIESAGISSHRTTYNRDVLQRSAWQFLDGASYGANSYAKGQLLLLTLERYLGEDRFAPMIKAYSTRHWWKHPRPEDFYAVVSEFAGEDMSWFLDQFLYGSGKLDYAAASISHGQPPPQRGWFGDDLLGEDSSIPESRPYTSEVLVRRLGEVQVPVEILIVFENGKALRETWDGQYRWKKMHYTSPHKVIQVVVDPDFTYVSDINRTNNSFSTKPQKLAPLRWVSKWLLWLQHALEVMAMLGG